MAALCASALALGYGSVRAETTQVYSGEARVAYLKQALEDLRKTPDRELLNTLNYLYVMQQNRCRAPTRSLEVDCLLQVARQSCSQKAQDERARCDRVSDVVVTNRLSQNVFLSRKARLDLRSGRGPYRYKLYRELRRHYATLVSEMSMSRGVGTDDAGVELAADIDAYCRERTSTQDMSWQHCAAAVVWFIGTSGRSLEIQP